MKVQFSLPYQEHMQPWKVHKHLLLSALLEAAHPRHQRAFTQRLPRYPIYPLLSQRKIQMHMRFQVCVCFTVAFFMPECVFVCDYSLHSNSFTCSLTTTDNVGTLKNQVYCQNFLERKRKRDIPCMLLWIH